jgi:hypothetical protein
MFRFSSLHRFFIDRLSQNLTTRVAVRLRRSVVAERGNGGSLSIRMVNERPQETMVGSTGQNDGKGYEVFLPPCRVEKLRNRKAPGSKCSSIPWAPVLPVRCP